MCYLPVRSCRAFLAVGRHVYLLDPDLEMATTITFLGTSSVTPEAGNDTASFLINGNILVDTGWYSAVRMLESDRSPLDLEYICLTHLHHDHYIGLPQLLFYRRMRQKDREELPPLKVVGPADDVQRVVDLSRALLQVERFPDDDCVPEVIPLVPSDALETEAFRIETCGTVHAVQGLCYRFTDKATGSIIGITGDTAYHPPIAKHLRGCSLLIHEAAHGARALDGAHQTGHSTARDAARIAAAADAGGLALVHLRKADRADALAAALDTFPRAFLPAEGEAVTL